eukprot:TRINITY_DN4807_c0_g2_i2.p1 TRINITY_DN4807_c0_g2~~TRINITY_DN4807_c0_g2_i2.p1  ORF type:complete len:1372 (+),score=356.68 TRINITY_DN4807_c0_g2_i2:40-4116(+)
MASSDSTLSDVRDVFRRFDTNGDGVLDMHELATVLKRVSPQWTDDLLSTLLSSLDASGDGLVQYEEFVDWLGRPLEGFDPGLRPLSRDFRGAIEQLRDSDSDSDEEKPVEAAAAAATGKKTAKGKPKSPGFVGVKCEKTLEFGKPVRSAVCIGKEVWTVDWHGVVTVRDRDDAAKTLGAIPTDRFVWSMLHIKPGLMMMGQEAQGISLFDSKKKEFKASLQGGHTGGITCLACDDSLGDTDSDEFPFRKAWSGSNDFTIREWNIYTWRSKKSSPTEVNEDKEAVLVQTGKWTVGFLKGRQMHGHKNGVKTLLKLGPILWSGSDDGTIRLWRCADGDCIETVEEAHKGPVNKLAIVKSSVWSAGADGIVKEWTMAGEKRECVRQMAPPGSEKGIYALLPVGHDVWVCGHHPAIQVFSQRDMSQISEEEGHKPYVSNLIGVDRVESKIIWTTSFGDRKLKVWRHTIRGEAASVDELKAANILYQQQEETQAERINGYLRRIRSFEESEMNHQSKLDGLTDALEEKTARLEQLENELGSLKRVFEEAGLGHLLTDLEALKAFTQRGARLEEALRALGLERLLDDPEELGRLLKTMLQLKDVLERCGFASILEDPTALESILTRYSAMQKAFSDHGFKELFEDSDKLDGFLKSHRDVRGAFSEAGFESLLDDAEAARRFFQRREEELSSALANAERLAALEQQVEDLIKETQVKESLDEQLASLKRVFEEAGLGHLLTDLEALKAFTQRGARLEEILRSFGLEHLLDDAEELGRRLQKLQELKEILERCGLDHILDNPSELEEILNRYKAMQKAFEEHGFGELFRDSARLDGFLSTHRQVRAAFDEAGHEELLDNAQAAGAFLAKFEQGEYDRRVMAKLRQVFEEAGQSKLLEEYETASTTVGDAEDDEEFLDEQADDEDDGEEENDEEELTAEDEDEDEDADAGGQENEDEAEVAEDTDAGAHPEEDSCQTKPTAPAKKLKRQGSSANNAPSFPAMRAYLLRNNAFENVLHDVGMAYLFDDPPELGRLLRLLQELRRILGIYGFEGVEKDPSQLAEVLSAYNALKAAFREHELDELFEDPEYSLKAFLRNYKRIRDEFDKYGLGYLFDSVPAMRDFLAKHHDMEQELKAMKEARAGEKLAARDAEMARLEGRLTKKEEEIEALKARLKEYEQLGDIDAVKKWKTDSEELKRLQRIYNSVSGRLSELERLLEAKEREREEALARERLMSVKYKELDIFKLDVIARELKGLDSELGRLGSSVKSLNNDAAKLKNYDEQQHIGLQGDRMMDQCKLLRAHIRDVINKCLSETQKMHIGVAIDDYLAAGELKDGGIMIAKVYEDIERPDHGHSKAAKLRQEDERRR